MATRKTTPTLQRKPKFTSSELEKLKQEVEAMKRVLFGSFTRPRERKTRSGTRWLRLSTRFAPTIVMSTRSNGNKGT
jgi:hypothetical protein